MIKGNTQEQRPAFRNYKPQNTKRKSDVMMEKLNSEGFVKELRFGSKYCFYVGKFSEAEKIEFGKTISYFTEEELNSESESFKYKLKRNWWIIERNLFDIDGNPVLHTKEDLEEMESFVSAYKSYETSTDGTNTKCRFNVYGTVKFPIDFSKINVLKVDGDNVFKYPYGAIFFSDSKNNNDMIKGKIACTENGGETLNKENNPYFSPIENPEFEIDGLIKTSGRLCIFYVDSEESPEDNSSTLYPSIKFIEITISALRKHYSKDPNNVANGFIDKMFVSRVEERHDLTDSVEDYILVNAFAKNETETNADTIIHNAADYIWLIGRDYLDYDISEKGFEDFRESIGLARTQHFIGEEYKKNLKKKMYQKPKSFEKKDISIPVNRDDTDVDSDDNETSEISQ